jgi:hypothetical protein
MKTLIIPLITILLFSSFYTVNEPCGNASYFRIGIDDLPGFNCCISDSFILQKKQIDRDTFVEQIKGQFLLLDFYSTESNANQLIYAIIKDQTTGKIIQTRLACDNSSTYFSSLVFLKKLHRKSSVYSDYSLSLMKIVNGEKDTLKCELGSFHIKNHGK